MLNVPLGIWGIFAYLLFGSILFLIPKYNREKIHIWSLLFLVSLIYSFAAIVFGTLSAYKIHSFCLLCIASYAISFGLLFSCWIIRRRFATASLPTDLAFCFEWFWKNKIAYGIPITLTISFLAVYQFIPHYWEYSQPKDTSNLRTGVTRSGHPWIGAENPTLTIEEFSDYQCFQCYKMQYKLRQLVQEHPDKIRLVHRHYPMDHEFNPTVVPAPFHVGSGKMSLLAIYATGKGKFWEMNDALFELGRSKKSFNTKYLAEKTGLPATELTASLSHPDVKKMLNYDILTGMKKRITATPSFVINGKVYVGFIPTEILQEAIGKE